SSISSFLYVFFFFSSRRRHTRSKRDWSSDVCSSDLDPSGREAIRSVVSRLTDYLIAHDYDLIDVTGKPTRWGQWSERYFRTEEGTYEAPLRSLELLSFLKTAQHITGAKKYAEAYADRIARGYADRVPVYRRWPGGGEINFS